MSKSFLAIVLVGYIISASPNLVLAQERVPNPQAADDRALLNSKEAETAKARWLGKPLWLRITLGFGGTATKRYSRVKVIDVQPSLNRLFTIEVVVKSDAGNTRSVSTSLNPAWWVKYDDLSDAQLELLPWLDFDSQFLTKDPRIQYKWPKHIWAAIEDGELLIGMTGKQCEMAWGLPETVNRTETRYGVSEQWVYRGRSSILKSFADKPAYLYFKNGVLTAIQR